MLAISALFAMVIGLTAAGVIAKLALYDNPQGEFCVSEKTIVDGVSHWSDCVLTAHFYGLFAGIFGVTALLAFLIAVVVVSAFRVLLGPRSTSTKPN